MNWLVKIVSKNKTRKGWRKICNWLVEVEPKLEESKRGREVVYWLIKIRTKSEVGKRGEGVNFLVKTFAKRKVGEGEGKRVNR